MSIVLESALREPVRSALQRRGYQRQGDEVGFFEYKMDLYGFAPVHDFTVAVELKLRKWKRAFEQAVVYQLCADFVFLALPMSTALRVDVPLLEKHGLGLLGVAPDLSCHMLCEANQSTVVVPDYRRFYINMMQGSDQ